MKTLIGITSISLCLTTFPLFAADTNANAASQETAQRVSQDPGKVLEVVADMVAKAPSSVAGIVKSAIIASKADAKLTAKIVETAIKLLPDQWYLIANAALAVAPDATAEINEVVARLVQNPLDIPGTPGLAPPAPNPPISIPTITPPPATEVDFTN